MNLSYNSNERKQLPKKIANWCCHPKDDGLIQLISKSSLRVLQWVMYQRHTVFVPLPHACHFSSLFFSFYSLYPLGICGSPCVEGLCTQLSRHTSFQPHSGGHQNMWTSCHCNVSLTKTLRMKSNRWTLSYDW